MAKQVFKPRQCEQCGVVYTPSHSTQKYCSHKCGQRHAYEGRKAVLVAFREGKLKFTKPEPSVG